MNVGAAQGKLPALRDTYRVSPAFTAGEMPVLLDAAPLGA
jgi:hypothetical protein